MNPAFNHPILPPLRPLPPTQHSSKITPSKVAPRASLLSRRSFLLTLASLATIPSPTTAQTPIRRTIFDEERELNEKFQQQAQENRTAALRAAFEAVEKAAVQLDDLKQLIEDKDWNSIHRFSRVYNNSVEREGMEPIARKLDQDADRKAALEVCKQVTQALIQVDRAASKEDTEAALTHMQEAADAIASFQRFKP